MAHLLLLDVPGGNDFTVLEDAVRIGHQVTFCTSDVGHYLRQGSHAADALALAREVLEIPGFEWAELERRVLASHATLPFGAVLCLIDIRLIEASLLAARLGLPFLNPESARLLRDKVRVRELLARHGIRQPAFAAASSADQLTAAVSALGYPVVVKPADGYGSQEVCLLENPADLAQLLGRLRSDEAGPADYGFGVLASRHLSVEQYVRGQMIGCDVLVGARERVMLGINDKSMLPPPSFAMRGSCFPSERYDRAAVQDYAFAILDAVDFNFGATHIEMIVTEAGPWLVEINPRLVSAQIPFQLGYAFGASLYEALIDLHLGGTLESWRDRDVLQFCAIRWLTSERVGTVQSIGLPAAPDDSIRRVVVFRQPGDAVRPPRNNGDRIAYVMAVGATQEEAEASAESFIAGTQLTLR
jgi:biotin carboxylase